MHLLMLMQPRFVCVHVWVGKGKCWLKSDKMTGEEFQRWRRLCLFVCLSESIKTRRDLFPHISCSHFVSNTHLITDNWKVIKRQTEQTAESGMFIKKKKNSNQTSCSSSSSAWFLCSWQHLERTDLRSGFVHYKLLWKYNLLVGGNAILYPHHVLHFHFSLLDYSFFLIPFLALFF